MGCLIQFRVRDLFRRRAGDARQDLVALDPQRGDGDSFLRIEPRLIDPMQPRFGPDK